MPLISLSPVYHEIKLSEIKVGPQLYQEGLHPLTYDTDGDGIRDGVWFCKECCDMVIEVANKIWSG